jgi:hypothetical protein
LTLQAPQKSPIENPSHVVALPHVEDDLKALLRSHDELRATLIIAGRHIRKLQFGRIDDPVLIAMRAELRKARSVRKRYPRTVRVVRVPIHLTR